MEDTRVAACERLATDVVTRLKAETLTPVRDQLALAYDAALMAAGAALPTPRPETKRSASSRTARTSAYRATARTSYLGTRTTGPVSRICR